MKTNLIYLLTLILTINISEGQNNYTRFDAIPVIITGDTLKNPWAGGLNSPQFSQIDLNGDGIKDLFAFERNLNGIVKTFLNGGTPDSVDYTYAPEYQSKFPQMSNWALLADYNCDGKEDIFTSVPGGMAVYRNDYDSIDGLKFTLITSLLYTEGSSGQVNLYVSSIDIPAIADIDSDGDLDILTFDDSSGTTVGYHRNYSMENYGNCDSLEYVLEDRCWGQFREAGLNNTITLGISCKTGKTSFDNNNIGIHSGSTILALDIDGDADKDVVLGDLSSNNMVLLINGGDSANASMVAQDPNFPSNTTQVNISIFPAGFHLDVNNDGKKDLLVAPNNPNSSENFTSVWYYENTGIIANQPFEYRKNNFLQDEMIEVGSGANPVFFDYNADGLLDIIIGNYGYYNTFNFTGMLALYKNIGTQTNPAFELINNDFSNISSLGLSGTYPAFGDLDGDGDEDMILGDWDGLLHYFENTAGAGNPASFVLSQPNYKNIDVGQFATPQLIDINRDGKLDLLIGERSGNLNYLENIGTTTNPEFSLILMNDLFGGIDVMVPCCSGYSVPYLFKDSTGSYVMLVGSEVGYTYYYGNIDGNLSGNFTLADSIYTGSFRVSVSGADINNDGKIELAVGEYPGGMAILKDIVLSPVPSGTTALTANTTATDATQGNCDGSATAIVSGGTSPYTYLWDDPNNQATQMAAGLCLGTYTVLVTDSIGDTATATVTINEITGIADIDFINYISIFPNPANTSIYLSLQGSHSQNPIQVYILNVLGQQILFKSFSKECRDAINGVSTFFGKAKTNYNNEINIAELAGGIYFVRILFNDQWITKKLIVQH